MNDKVPEFAIFQNSRTRQSAIWTRTQGRWHDAAEGEFDALWTLVHIIRNSDDVPKLMSQLVTQIQEIQKDKDVDPPPPLSD